jgi:hypothetical protein
MDTQKIQEFVQLRRKAGDNDSQIAAFLKSKGVEPTPAMFGAAMKTGLSGVAQTLGESLALNSKDYQGFQKSSQGLGDMNLKLLQTIRANKAAGKDTSRLEKQYKINTGNEVNIADIAPTVNKTNKALAGDLIQTAGYLAAPLSAGSVAGRVAMGAGMGAVGGVGDAMSNDKDGQDILASSLRGASIGAIISGTLEAVGAGLRAVGKSNVVQNKTANTYLKELQPPKKEVANQIERTPVGKAFKTIGAQIRDEVDEAGKPLYTGTYQTILDKAKTNLAAKGKALTETLARYDDAVINKNEIAGDIVGEMQDRMGRLKPSELKIITQEINRITEGQITPTQALEYKRLFDSKIPDSFWTDTADRTRAIAVQARYILRDNLRKLINEKTGDATVKALNHSMGLAMDVRRMAAVQLAQRSLEKVGEGPGSQSLFRMIYGKLIDDTIFNPAITTNAAQGLSNMGQKTGQTATRATARNLTIQQSSKEGGVKDKVLNLLRDL